MGAPINKAAELIKSFMAEAAEDASEIRFESQVASKEALSEDESVGVASLLRRAEKNELSRSKVRVEKTRETEKSKVLKAKDPVEGFAEKFLSDERRQYPGQSVERLARVRKNFDKMMAEKAESSEKVTAADIIAILAEEYGEDAFLANEAFEFLRESFRQEAGKGVALDKDLVEVNNELGKAQNQYRKDNQRSIELAEATLSSVKKATEAGVGTGEELRILNFTVESAYRDDLNSSDNLAAVYDKIIPLGMPPKKGLQRALSVQNSMAEAIKKAKTNAERSWLTASHNDMKKIRLFIGMHRFFGKREPLVRKLCIASHHL